MSEYIIEWFGIGARITELVGSETPCLAVKHLREERLREPIVRCRNCKHANEVTWPASSKVPPDYRDCGGPLVETWDYYNDQPKDNPVPPDGFCFCGERREP